MRIAPSIHRVGRSSFVNVYLVEEAGEVTIIDAGMPGHYADLVSELAAMGRTLEDVRALVLTHGHSDHIGFAERLRHERAIPVEIHEADAALARGEAPNPAKGLGAIRPLPLLAFLWFALRRNGLSRPRISDLSTFGDGATLDVPGSPQVINVPGHTPGSVALWVRGRDALFVGDALSTYAVTTGRRGPQIAPFTADPAQARASLAHLDHVEARWLLPGHGEAWDQGVASALQAMRAS